MIYYVDIDETICNSPENRDYSMAKPIKHRIEKINSLYEQGNTVIYWTARGSGTGIDWEAVTRSQLKEWGVKFNDVKFGKPVYDLFIDDKNISSQTFFGDDE